MQIGRHTLFNLVGLGAPLVVAVFTIPVLLRELGNAQFGLLTLIWAVVSYFGLFDLGLGRALTLQLAALFAKAELALVGPTVTTAGALMAALGVLAGVAMALAAPWGIGLIHEVPDTRQAIRAVQALALSMPAIVLTSGLRGILEARHAFGTVNLIRLPMGLFTFVGPLAVVLWLGARLDWIALVLCLGRWVALIAHLIFAWRVIPREGRRWSFQPSLVRPLCVSGGWLTVSNIISPFMGYADRFVIGAMVSAAAVAFYATPNELITKLWIVPGALTAVLFPAFASHLAERSEALQPLFRQAVHGLFLVMLPLTLFFALFAHEVLATWIHEDFARQSADLMRVFALGMLLNSLAHVPFTLIQSSGRAKLTAWIHAVELPLFLLALWLLTRAYGLSGAAMAWLLRIAVDTALMMFVCIRTLGWPGREFVDGRALILLALTVVGFAGVGLDAAWIRAGWLLAIAGMSVWLMRAWRRPSPRTAPA